MCRSLEAVAARVRGHEETIRAARTSAKARTVAAE
jgi:hypothetical protein